MEKICKLCKEVKSSDWFYLQRRPSYCKKCVHQMDCEYRSRNREKIRTNAKKYTIKNKLAISERQKPKQRLRYSLLSVEERKLKYDRYNRQYNGTLIGRFSKWRSGAMARGIEFSIDISDLYKIPMICHYTGMALTLEQNNINTISLDRIDNLKAYTIDNICFCCAIVNRMKNNLDLEEFYRLCGLIVENRHKNNL